MRKFKIYVNTPYEGIYGNMCQNGTIKELGRYAMPGAKIGNLYGKTDQGIKNMAEGYITQGRFDLGEYMEFEVIRNFTIKVEFPEHYIEIEANHETLGQELVELGKRFA
jgi:hypothetical protein